MPDTAKLPGRILIVDDDPLVCALLERSLGKEGFAVSIVHSGEAAIERALSFKPDLVILDVTMPGMDGYQTCEALNRNPLTNGTPVIFLTAKTEPEDLERGLELGAADYLSKPFRPAELLVRLRARLKAARERLGSTKVLPKAPAVPLPGSMDPDPDNASARMLTDNGMISAAQLDEARAFQARAFEQGLRLSLLETLAQIGAITESQREMAEQKLEAMAYGGAQQLGPYRLIKKLGAGGMGAVYLSEDTVKGRPVALKVLAPRYNDDLEFLARFRREAGAMMALQHPNLAAAYEVGEALGLHYFAMEYCEGETLEKLLDRDGRMEWRTSARIIAQVAAGLQCAHTHGVLHRDVKPSNIMLAPSGVAKLFDFGLLKRIETQQQSISTETGATLGTPAYIAPEQARAEKGIDGRADIYALGGTFYHLLTGSPPFGDGAPALILTKHLTDPVPDPCRICPDLPSRISAMVMKMMAKMPVLRYQDCDQVCRELEVLIQRP